MLHRVALFAIVISVVVALVAAEAQQTEALPQGCSTSGTKVTLRAGGASLFLDSSSNFRVQPSAGVDKFVVQNNLRALPTFLSEVSIGPSTSNCIGNLATLNGDLVAYVNPDPRIAAPSWLSLTSQPVMSTDAIADVNTLSELYQVTQCGGPLGLGDVTKDLRRDNSCKNLLNLPGILFNTQLSVDISAGGANPVNIVNRLGASGTYNSISNTILSSYGTIQSSGGVIQRATLVVRSSPGDYAFSGEFLTYSLSSYDVASSAVYNTYAYTPVAPTPTTPIGTPGNQPMQLASAVTAIGREFWLTNFGSQLLTANEYQPSGLILYYNCPQVAIAGGNTPQTTTSCDSVTLISIGDELTYFGFTTTQPTSLLAQQSAIIPPGLIGAPPVGANLFVIRNQQLVIDAQGQFHIFFHSFSGAVGAQTMIANYMFCPATHDRTSLSGFLLDATKCRVQQLYSVTQDSTTENRLSAKFFNGTKTAGPTIVVASYALDNRRDDVFSATFTTFAVRMFTFTPKSVGAIGAWQFTSTIIPPLPTPINGVDRSTVFAFPTTGRLYDFNLAITDDDTTPVAVAISYSYSRYQNSYNNKKRAVPGNADASAEEYVFRTILCPEFRCLSYNNRQLIGSRTMFHSSYGTVPRGLSAIISGSFNGGRPVFGFSVGSGDRDRETRTASQPPLPGNDVAGGSVGLLFCLDALCRSASLQRSSDYLAGHRGDILLMPTPIGVLVSTLPVVATKPYPVYQSFQNPAATPTATLCSATTAGLQRTIDGEAFICTALPDSPILDAIAVFYWAPVAAPLQAMVSMSPTNIGTPPTGLTGTTLPTC